ncbi:hypothetical protein [Arcticibacter tournemirensis]|uniref:Uncharacterized protein n=1 Tax=Arcticibacter tournemirensis TaxID=699437 RepID=A0A4Q0MB50_9SPHI|nr:hypothetical protein [Arcticibacter tournemirensis]RXF70520.1 hypothetical protein EKH83_07710 [Arcticibacter tournemirensis]
MINKVPVKKLIEFRRFSEKRQAGFASRLKVPKKSRPDDKKGGDYWISCTSCLANAFKANNNIVIKQKIEEVSEKFDLEKRKLTRIMYQRNIEILQGYADFDFSIFRPSHHLNFLSKPRISLIIKGIPVQVDPDQVFSYRDGEVERIGAIYFVAWKENFKRDDLGVFSEALFEYLSFLYPEKYEVDPNFCLAVEASSARVVRYFEVLSGEVKSVLIPTIDEINKYL